MKTLYLVTKGYAALVDDEDYDKVILYRWRLSRIYAIARVEGINTSLHRFVMSAKYGEMVDHKNRNGLDCRKDNLRLCTSTTNQYNREKTRVNKSGYKGVYYDNSDNRVKCWRAVIKKDGKNISIGSFYTPEEAAIAYDAAALKYHGEFAKANYSD